MDKQFASAADLEEKKVSFEHLSGIADSYTAAGDPNTRWNRVRDLGVMASMGEQFRVFPDPRTFDLGRALATERRTERKFPV